jgi:hypothetical protein
VPTTYQDPSASAKDAVRFRIGDTDTTDAFLTDGEIVYCLGVKDGEVLSASILAINMIVARLSYDAQQETVGPVSQGGTASVIDALQKAAAGIAAEMALGASIIVTGITRAEKLHHDRSLVQPTFRKPLRPGLPLGSDERFLGEAAVGNIPFADDCDGGPTFF